jgi:leucine dehydrogenase
MVIFSQPDFDEHESVHAWFDAATGLKCFIAIHSTALGPAWGGCRMWPFGSEDDAIRDVLRLSRGMSYKNAMAGLAYGGGKAVIIGDPRHGKSPALFEAFGRAVDQLGGRYITAEDVGTSVEDMQMVARVTEHVGGIPKAGGYRGGDPSPKTAYGVYQGMRAAAEVALRRDSLAGLTIAIQGVGNVGYHLCRLLSEAGARLVVADLNQQSVERAVQEFGATPVPPDRVLEAEADILAPCALGGVLSARSIPALNVKLVAGAANNQLSTAADGERLHARGIVYAPDYVVNAGGIIAVAAERESGVDSAEVMARIDRIYERTRRVLEVARETGRPPHEVADELAREIIRSAKAGAVRGRGRDNSARGGHPEADREPGHRRARAADRS